MHEYCIKRNTTKFLVPFRKDGRIMKSTVAYRFVHKIKILVLLRDKARSSPMTRFLTFLIFLLVFSTFIALNCRNINIYNIFSTDMLNLRNSRNVIRDVIHCYDRPLEFKVQQRGRFWVFYNYIPAEKRHRCFESITYTTHGDYTFLDNIEPLLERWRGPISVAIHAPGFDFQPTLESIAYLRNCGSSLIKKYVTFHLIFNADHIPTDNSSKPFVLPLINMYNDTYNCHQGAPFANKNYTALYKTFKNITYPINVVRNVAREAAQTHFVLASDIELYPTPNLISEFLSMVSKHQELFKSEKPKVFVLPVFEVPKNELIPKNKMILRKMFESKRAFTFHKRLCSSCHSIPNITDWFQLNGSHDLNVFMSTKRKGLQAHWEPFYIGTRDDPSFDERLSWEGQSNKMSQAYAMCLLDYSFDILDNAFLVHKPGIKKFKVQIQLYAKTVRRTRSLFRYIKKELRKLYGARLGCF